MGERRGEGLLGQGAPGRVLSPPAIAAVFEESVTSWPVTGQRVLILVPDGTRSAPLPLLHRQLSAALWRAGAAGQTWLVALGTHRPLERHELEALLGVRLDEHSRTTDGSVVRNHAWRAEGDLVDCGTLDASFLAQLANEAGLVGAAGLSEDVPVRVNAAVAEHDLVIVLGPVFPHEVVGFSGGNKYFFPGISGPEMIDASHWLGALITSREIIGTLGVTPVRKMINQAASMLPIERRCIAFVVAPHDEEEETAPTNGPSDEVLCGLYAGSCEAAWTAAAELSSAVHLRRVAAPLSRVVAVMPTRYEDLWTGAKGMYKLEPVVADGGEVILYAPHIREFSSVHGAELEAVGYHCRDYFIGQWDRFSQVARSVLAHSTHLRGQGTYDPATGIESCRIRVTLATGIDAERCAAMNLGYRDPALVDLSALALEEGTLVVERAGEMLYRLRDEKSPSLAMRQGAGA